MVVEAVKTCFDVSLDKPYRPFEIDVDMLERGVAAPFGPKPVRVRGKIRFINALQNHADDFLYQFVACGGDTQRPFLFWQYIPVWQDEDDSCGL